MTDLTLNTPAQDVIAPLQQEGTKAVLRTWLKAVGAPVRQHEPVVELETDKVMVEVCAPCDGVLDIVVQEGQDVLPGALLGRVAAALLEQPAPDAPRVERPVPAESEDAERDQPLSDIESRLSPAVRRLLAEHDLDPATLKGCGTGRGGRLTREDVVRAVQRLEAPAAPEPVEKAPSAPAGLPVEDSTAPRVAERIPHSSMRRRIAEHMQHSVSVAPHVTAVFEADCTAIIQHRQRHKAEYAGQGVNLTFTAYFVAAAVQAMQSAPQVNSRWHEDALEVFSDVNIGVGAALGDQGLIVPVIRQAQTLSLLGIASRLHTLTELARTSRLKPADVQGGTFTISNHGVSGSLLATPVIINQPQSAILGVGALQKRVVVREVDGVDSFQARTMAYVSLTIDHRVLDGSQTNAWLRRFVEVLETWGD
ncbi:dihydrolipoamide acetyltransferase family protein [Pseudomonas ovata]|uniref:dihydrolipoamide acetyltransferase family protein n=1 Tax=Pseudomonas ovata TaxID=1839709 RepID=UPI000D69B631|nr:2-oxo acid dehydrogenase subunit E2 [Pseudomonas ovata]